MLESKTILEENSAGAHGYGIFFSPLLSTNTSCFLARRVLFAKATSGRRGRDYKEAPRCGDKKRRRVERTTFLARVCASHASVRVSGDHPLQQRSARAV